MSDSSPSRVEWARETMSRYEVPLVAFARKITGDLETARDVVQDTFLRLLQQDPAGIDNLSSWLYTVCRRRALDVKRKDQRMTPTSQSGALDQESPEPPPLDALEARELRGELARCLGHLDDRQQEILRLKFQAGLSYAEIGRVMGISVSNVGFLICTAVKALRAAMSPPAAERRRA